MKEQEITCLFRRARLKRNIYLKESNEGNRQDYAYFLELQIRNKTERISRIMFPEVTNLKSICLF